MEMKNDAALQWMYEGNSGHTAEDVLTGKVRLDAADVRKSVGLRSRDEKELYSASSTSFIGSAMMGAKASTLDANRTSGRVAMDGPTVSDQDSEGQVSAAAVEELRKEIRRQVRAARAAANSTQDASDKLPASQHAASVETTSIESRVQCLDRRELDEMIYRLLR